MKITKFRQPRNSRDLILTLINVFADSKQAALSLVPVDLFINNSAHFVDDYRNIILCACKSTPVLHMYIKPASTDQTLTCPKGFLYQKPL